jgi:predicted enzyme related to lactoylglutathione lyase
MPDSSFHYVELPAVSLERAMQFYRTVFDWRFEAPPPEHKRRDVVYLDRVPEVGLCMRATPARGTRPAIAVASIDATLELVQNAGGRLLEQKVDVGDGYTAAFVDSEGNEIGLWQFKSTQRRS